MKRLLFSTAVSLSLLSAAPARAADQPRLCSLGPILGTVAAPISLNAAEASRTISLGPNATCVGAGESTPVRVASFRYLVLTYTLVNDKNSTLVATHTVGYSAATAAPGVCSVAAGVCTLSPATVTNMAVTGALVESQRIGIKGWPYHKIIMSEATADADDTILVTGLLTD
jgi:hypothetical protein